MPSANHLRTAETEHAARRGFGLEKKIMRYGLDDLRRELKERAPGYGVTLDSNMYRFVFSKNGSDDLARQNAISFAAENDCSVHFESREGAVCFRRKEPN
jgi:hypothetical protein